MEERRSVVASGKTIEDAVKNGLGMLGLRREQVDVEVISEGSRGVLGFGAENARVRLLARSAPPARQPEPAPAAQAVEPGSRASGPEPVATPEAKKATQEPAPSQVPAKRAPVSSEPAKASPEQAGQEILTELLQQMGIRATVEVRTDDDLADEGQAPAPILNLTGDDLGILIGRRGETLRALQYLLRLMVSHRVKHWTNLVVDVESFRVRRRQALESLSHRVADEVARSGRSQALEPMPPDERRVVHITLRNHPKVMTQSTGEGERRKVTVIPRQ